MKHQEPVLVSTLDRLEAVGVKKIELLRTDGIRDLLRAELTRRLTDPALFTAQELEDLATDTFREFTVLLNQHLGVGAGSQPPRRTTKAAAGTDGVFVVQPNGETASIFEAQQS